MTQVLVTIDQPITTKDQSAESKVDTNPTAKEIAGVKFEIPPIITEILPPTEHPRPVLDPKDEVKPSTKSTEKGRSRRSKRSKNESIRTLNR